MNDPGPHSHPAVPRRSTLPSKRLLAAATAVGLLAAILGPACATHHIVVEQPPRVDLHQFGTVGIVEFSASDGYPLQQEVTHRFLATVQGAQPGVRVLELGSERDVLAAVGRSTLDPEALRAVAEKYRVDAVLAGELTVSKVRPRVTVGEGLRSIAASVQVDGALRANLRDTAGLTVWTNGAHGTWTLGGLGVGPTGHPSVGVADPAQTYDEMLSQLVALTTDDFRSTYERREVQER